MPLFPLIVKHNGVIVNTCGWVEKQGYDILVESLKAFDIDVILVLDDDRLFSNLSAAFETPANAPSPIVVRKLNKSGGVVTRSREVRTSTRLAKIKHYFYGSFSLFFFYMESRMHIH